MMTQTYAMRSDFYRRKFPSKILKSIKETVEQLDDVLDRAFEKCSHGRCTDMACDKCGMTFN